MPRRRFTPTFDACECRLPLDGAAIGPMPELDPGPIGGVLGDPGPQSTPGPDPGDVQDPGIPSPYLATPSGPIPDDPPLIDPSGYSDPDPRYPMPVAPIDAYT